MDPEDFINLPYDVFEAWVDTTVFVGAKRAKPLAWPRLVQCNVTLRTFPKHHKIQAVAEFDEEGKAVDFTNWFANGGDEFLTYADTTSSQLVTKVQNVSRPMNEFADIQRGVTPFNLTDAPDHKHSIRAFAGTVRRYSLDSGERKFIRFDDTLAELKPERYFKGPRLLLRELISRKFQLQAVKVVEDFVTNKSMQSILRLPNAPDLNYLLACLNSKLLSWYFLKLSNIAQRDDFPKIVLKETRNLPIRPVNFSEPADKVRHDKIVELVDRMLELNQQKHSGKLAPSQVERVNREIAATDAEIDNLVYELYAINDKERAIIEKA